MFHPLSWPRVDGDFENEESELSNGSGKKEGGKKGGIWRGRRCRLCVGGRSGDGSRLKLAGCADGWEMAIV